MTDMYKPMSMGKKQGWDLKKGLQLSLQLHSGSCTRHRYTRGEMSCELLTGHHNLVRMEKNTSNTFASELSPKAVATAPVVAET